MKYRQANEQIARYRQQIAELRDKLRATQSEIQPEEIDDYVFQRAGGGSMRLSELFGDKDTLFVIHNMGSGCPYCTLWADGFNGVYGHLSNRAAFVLTSPDAPDVQQRFAAGRGWRFPYPWRHPKQTCCAAQYSHFAGARKGSPAGGMRPLFGACRAGVKVSIAPCTD